VRSERWIAQRWLVAFVLGGVLAGVAVEKQNWGPAVALGALAILSGVMGGLRWRRAGG